MSRYFLFLVMMNMIANVVAFVPRTLLSHRLDGAVLSIVIGIIISLIYMYIFSNAMLAFPGKTQPEILCTYLPKWFAVPFLWFVGFLYFVAGWFTLLSFVKITKQFVNPEMSEVLILLMFLSLVGFGALIKSEKVLYALEIILWIYVPIIVIIFIKSFTDPYLSWDSIRTALTHYRTMPSLEAIGATSYSLLGFYHLSIFNKAFISKMKRLTLPWLIIIGLTGTLNIFTTVYIPIGFNGVDGVGHFMYPWISTADSMRMEFAFMERVLFIFLLLIIGISLITSTVNFHSALETLKSSVPKVKIKNTSITPYLIVVVFSIITGLSVIYLSDKLIYQITKLYFISLLPVGLFVSALMLWVKRRAKQQ